MGRQIDYQRTTDSGSVGFYMSMVLEIELNEKRIKPRQQEVIDVYI